MKRGLLVLALTVGLGLAIGLPATARAECVETASGEARPQLVDAFPERGTSGYAATLHVVGRTARGRRSCPGASTCRATATRAGRSRRPGSPSRSRRRARGRGSRALDVDAKTAPAPTTLDLPLVALPPEPGRHVLSSRAPRLGRAREQRRRDALHEAAQLIVEDPTASTPDAQPRPNPPPRAQREEWMALERALSWCARRRRRRWARSRGSA